MPKNLISFFCGFLSRLKFPFPLNLLLNSLFVRLFGINVAEAEKALKHYPSIEDVFTRRLKKGSRPIKGRISSPADGYLAKSAPANKQQAVQVKGLTYSLQELIFGSSMQSDDQFTASWYTTIYLAPHNYHRVHSPIAGKLISILYVPGKLWPVNSSAVHSIPSLFIKNERLVFEIQTPNMGNVYVVMVGAFNVGRISTEFWPDFVTNSWKRQGSNKQSVMKKNFSGITIEQGEELGVFMLGSTVVLVFSIELTQELRLTTDSNNAPIKMGDSLEHRPENLP